MTACACVATAGGRTVDVFETRVRRGAWGAFVAAAGLLCLQSSLAQPQQSAQPEPKADARATVVVGHARFTVLTPKLIRMEWSADGVFEDRASFVFLNRRMPVPAFTQSVRGSGSSAVLTLSTGGLRLTYKPGSGDGQFTAATLQVSFDLDGKPVVWHPGLENAGNLQGTSQTLDGARGDKLRFPMQPGLLSRAGWDVVDDSSRPLFDSTDFSFKQGEQSAWPWVAERPAGKRQDLYIFGYGHAYKEELGDYVRVAGRIPLPPRFAFGAWWSRYWAYSDQELEDLVRSFHQNSVPLDVLVIDMDWHPNFGVHTMPFAEAPKDASGERKGWGGYSWNKTLFPDPQDFLDRIHSEGLKTTLNLHPATGVQPWEDAYPAMASAMGIDPATKQYVPFDITNKKFATNYMDLLHHPLERQGIDFWWLDWQANQATAMPGVSATWWLNYVHFTDQEREGKRPLLFHRWGGLGNHRYEIGFSGDTISVWESLAYQPWFTATAANVGYAYWSHDIGGHMPGEVGPELFTRWIQFGAFSPILRTHTTNNPDSERRIWAYPEPYADIMRSTFQQRYALQPYIYTEGRRTYDTGVAFVHPLYYEWPEAPEAYDTRNEYMFGDEMMMAPVTQPVDTSTNLAKVSLWIPPGDWMESTTGRHITGPRKLDAQYSISQVPQFIRSGGIVPMQPAMEYTGEKPVDPLIVNVMPLLEGQKSSYTLYEDNSHAEGYKDGECAWTQLDAARAGGRTVFTVNAVRGSYDGMLQSRGYEVRLPGNWPPETVKVNGSAVAYQREPGKPGWRYEGNTLTTIITIPSKSTQERLTLEVGISSAAVGLSERINGFAGAETRLREAYDAINHAGNKAWSPEALTLAWQTGDRISYRPNTVRAEIAAFPARWAAAKKDVDALVKALPAAQANESKDATNYRVMIQRAGAALEDGATLPAASP